ncbi:MAG: hypothetical protein ACJ8F1_18040 [Polyangia bacterium]
MRYKLLRSMLLGLAVGVVAVPIARADATRPEAGATASRGGSGAERINGQPELGAPHAPSIVGQSPLSLQAGDPYDVEKQPKAAATPASTVILVVPPPPAPPADNGSDLNDQGDTGK